MVGDAVYGIGRRVSIPDADPIFGMETLDAIGIDIDQDPRAFAKFLELKNLMQERNRRLPPRWSAPRPTRRL
jgi:hypothetical protein